MGKKETLDNNLNCERGYLTFRQKEVLGYLRKGLLNKQIAHAMGLSVSTIKLHISGIFIRLNVNTRTAAVVKAQELGLI
ncbi:MAG: response regulator transcription factor [Alphaproteobacteria bacterium]|nr:response regulator transcription factor [Alphaproteobacteria bacterium]